MFVSMSFPRTGRGLGTCALLDVADHNEPLPPTHS